MFSNLHVFIESGLLGHEVFHGVALIPVVFFLWRKYQSYNVVLVALITTFVIDIDHLVDYLGFLGLRVDLRSIAMSTYFKQSGYIFTPLHGWEYVILFFVIFYYSKNRKAKPYYLAIALGLLAHYIWDSIWISNALHYSILWRALNGFRITI